MPRSNRTVSAETAAAVDDAISDLETSEEAVASSPSGMSVNEKYTLARADHSRVAAKYCGHRC